MWYLIVSIPDLCTITYFDSDFFPECKSKSISGCFTHQARIFDVKCFSAYCGYILVDSKSGESLMPNDLIALGFSMMFLHDDTLH